jgi:hypothetical protein
MTEESEEVVEEEVIELEAYLVQMLHDLAPKHGGSIRKALEWLISSNYTEEMALASAAEARSASRRRDQPVDAQMRDLQAEVSRATVVLDQAMKRLADTVDATQELLAKNKAETTPTARKVYPAGKKKLRIPSGVVKPPEHLSHTALKSDKPSKA